MDRPVRGLIGWCSLTLLLSAFLLFQVQPMVSKMILPWFGGGPTVWTTCMLFFQVFLLLGYSYAHLLDRFPRTRMPAMIHLVLLVVALYGLPVTPAASWQPTDSAMPQWRILLLLSANVGMPYLLLAASAPLIQAWFGRVVPGRSPYRFYALSNIGSLAALLTYPFVIEPKWDTATQGTIWSIGFGVFTVLVGSLAVAVMRWNVPVSEPCEEKQFSKAMAGRPQWFHFLIWLVLPAFGSMSLLAVTNQICQDVAVVPFLWIAPLSLYLLTFILCFDSDRWYWRGVFSVLTIVVVVGISAILISDQVQPWIDWAGIDYTLPDILDSITKEVTLFLILLFCICMLCHGEVVRCKPDTRYLTSFYLLIAAGGAIGGSFVAVLCPALFNSHVESSITLIGGLVLAVALICFSIVKWSTLWRMVWIAVFGLPLLLVLIVVFAVPVYTAEKSVLVARRNFYGILTVATRGEPGDEDERRLLLNGRILHGMQYWAEDRRHEATTYYNDRSGIGLALDQLGQNGPIRVGVVGLGAGTVAIFGRHDDYYCFYEINPDVIDIAHQFFTYLKDCPADVEVVEGDARLALRQQSRQNFDLLALDAFSSDAIPVHLLTVEAFECYVAHMKPSGVIAVHVSNRHLDLCPIVVQLADRFDLEIAEVNATDEGEVGISSSQWLLLAKDQGFFDSELLKPAVSELQPADPRVRIWTDQYSNLFQILKRDDSDPQHRWWSYLPF